MGLALSLMLAGFAALGGGGDSGAAPAAGERGGPGLALIAAKILTATEAAPAWEAGAKPATSRVSTNIKPKRKVAALFKAE